VVSKLEKLLASRVINESIESVLLPTKVVSAMKVDFGLQITGYLICAAAEGLRLVGIVFGDSTGRFADGHSIRTSMVLSQEVIHGYVIAETLNSRYVICGWLCVSYKEYDVRSDGHRV
jgi:hypothetical protein